MFLYLYTFAVVELINNQLLTVSRVRKEKYECDRFKTGHLPVFFGESAAMFTSVWRTVEATWEPTK